MESYLNGQYVEKEDVNMTYSWFREYIKSWKMYMYMYIPEKLVRELCQSSKIKFLWSKVEMTLLYVELNVVLRILIGILVKVYKIGICKSVQNFCF